MQLTKAEAVMLVSLVHAKLITMQPVKKSTEDIVKEHREESLKEEGLVEKETPAPRKKPVPYTPGVDDPPQVILDVPPPREEPKEAVLAPENKACICTACDVIAYTTNRPIHNNCKVPVFRESFTPPLPRTGEITHNDQGIAIDCPHCGGNKTVQLTGKKKTNAEESGSF
jgi:hypothetical protein